MPVTGLAREFNLGGANSFCQGVYPHRMSQVFSTLWGAGGFPRWGRRPPLRESGIVSRGIVFHKPYGVLTSFTDPAGRPTLARYIAVPDVYAAGRLDVDSEGLLVLTSDGALAHRITDPRHKLPKVYWAQVERIPTAASLDRLRMGVVLGNRRTRPAQVRLLAEPPALAERAVPIRYRKSVPTAWIELIIHEGMNRQVRRMTAAVGHPTLRLVRVAIGPLRLGDLAPGQWRPLSEADIRSLAEPPGSPRGGGRPDQLSGMSRVPRLLRSRPRPSGGSRPRG